MRFDVVVIGSGPGGSAAALQAAKLGLEVALVERDFMLGGACVHTGTIPSKTLRETVVRLTSLRSAAQLGIHSTYMRQLSVQDLMSKKDEVIHNHVNNLISFLERNRVTVFPGSASFVAPDKIRVATPHDEQVIHARNVVIATGSRPRRPENIPFDGRVILDSDTVLNLDAIPRSLTVMGAGVIGTEYACIFAALGVKVTLIDRRERMMRFVDDDILDILYFRMRRMGVKFATPEAVDEITRETTGKDWRAVVKLKSGRVVKSDRLLVAAGRESNVMALDLEKAGIETDEHGLIKVDEYYQSQQANVYAVGDVVGFPALAGTSMYQGRAAVLHAAGTDVPPQTNLPIAIYTIPEISQAGLSERDAREQGIVYEVGTARYGEIPRGQIQGETDGMLKVVFKRDDHKLLGVHLVGEGSSELVHLGLHVIQRGGTVDELATCVFNYPTLSEAYRVAALDGLNRL